MEWVTSNLDSEHVLWATVTLPLTDTEHYQSAIEKYFNVIGEYDSLVTFTPFKHFTERDSRLFAKLD